MMGDTADIVGCVTQQELFAVQQSIHCVMCHTQADMICYVTEQMMSAVSHSRECLLCGAEDNGDGVTQQMRTAPC